VKPGLDASDPSEACRATGPVLESVFAAVAEAILILDEAGRISDSNAAAEKMFGLTPEKAHGLTYPELLTPERRREAREFLAAASSGGTRRTTAVAVRADGTRLIVETACSSFPGSAERSGGLVVCLRDVTVPLLTHSAVAAVGFEPDAPAALASFREVLGGLLPVENLTLTALEGRSARRLASAGPIADRLPSGELLSLEGTPIQLAVELRRPVVCLDTGAGDLPYDELLARHGLGSYVVLPLFRRAQAIATLNVGFATVGSPTAGVVRLLGSLAGSIMPVVLNLVTLEDREIAIQRLEQLDATKNEFLALITHELRTPLAIVGGFANRLRSRWGELSHDEKLESIEAIDRNARSMYRLVEGGLQVARLESDAFDYDVRPVDLADEATRAVSDLATEGGDRIRVTVEPDLPRALCDPQRHWEILMNLLSNALKFSPADAPIDVEVTRRRETVQLAVRDRGPGIEPGDLPKLFRKFSRVGDPEYCTPGTGLGLYIAKAMVEAQGGTIWVRSTPGDGSTFAYALPIAGAAQADVLKSR
jgi:PAS domain S-box-containing protein